MDAQPLRDQLKSSPLLVLAAACFCSTQASAQCLYAEITAQPPAVGERHGSSVSQSVVWTAVGSPGANGGMGAVDLYELSGDWVHVQRWNGTQANGRFGEAVAVDFGFPPKLLIGAPGEGQGAGEAYIALHNGATWGALSPLSASLPLAVQPQPGDRFGCALAADDFFVVGAEGFDAGVATDAGTAFAFDSGGYLGQLLPSTPVAGAEFGHSIAVDNEDGTVVVGAWREGANDEGAAYVLEDCGNTWFEFARLQPPVVRAGQRFGSSVSITIEQVPACDPTLFFLVGVGAPGDDLGLAGGADTGSVHLFCGNIQNCASLGWPHFQSLTDPVGQPGDLFGAAIDLADDEVLIGAPGTQAARGAAQLWAHDGVSFAQTGMIVGNDSSPGDAFGTDLSTDGFGFGLTVIGAPGHDHAGVQDSGSAYLAFVTEIGVPVCSPAVPNSTGTPGVIHASGSAIAAFNLFALCADHLPPGQFGYFLVSDTQGFVMPPGSDGFLCLAGTIGRYNAPGQTIQGPQGALFLDLTALPLFPPVAVQPGETWLFQCWYRDVGGTNNFTDTTSVTYQ